jgi:hypothetical protein
MVKEGITMDFPTTDMGDAERKTTAVLTSLVDILNHISNHLGSPINFDDKPITKKPTSKKVDVGGKMETDKSSLGNKSIPGMAISQTKPKITKANPYKKNTRDFTGSLVVKEDIDEAVEENQQEFDESNKAMDSLSTSEGKKLVSTLQDAAKALSKFLNTTRVPNASALKPNDMRLE